MAESIFDGIIRDEPDFSRLLCNFLREFEEFRIDVLQLLFSNGPERGKPHPRSGQSTSEESDLSSQLMSVEKDEIQTEVVLPEKCGRPDVVIRSDKLCLIIEVKTRPKTKPTEKQLVTETDVNSELQEVSRYIDFLSKKPGTNIDK